MSKVKDHLESSIGPTLRRFKALTWEIGDNYDALRNGPCKAPSGRNFLHDEKFGGNMIMCSFVRGCLRSM